MHELSVTTSILNIALQHCEGANAAHITDLYLVVGQLSSIIDDSVQFYWNIISQDTAAEGSQLHFRRIPGELECTACGARYRINGDDFLCPTCGSAAVTVVAGDEFYLEAIEVDDPVKEAAL